MEKCKSAVLLLIFMVFLLIDIFAVAAAVSNETVNALAMLWGALNINAFITMVKFRTDAQ